MTEFEKRRQQNEELLKEWQGGVVQKQKLAERREEEKRVAEKPFAQYELDKEVEDEIKNKDRFGDPLKLMGSRVVKSKHGNKD